MVCHGDDREAAYALALDRHEVSSPLSGQEERLALRSQLNFFHSSQNFSMYSIVLKSGPRNGKLSHRRSRTENIRMSGIVGYF